MTSTDCVVRQRSRAAAPRRATLLIALGSFAFIAGCGYRNYSENIGPSATPVTQAPAVQRLGPVPGELRYLLQPGDQFDVKFFYNPELNESVLVRPDGNIELQLVGEIHAAGVAPADLVGELKQRYGATLRRPEVAVIVRKYASQKAYIAGEVANPGAVAVDGPPMTVLEAIMGVGGFRPTAERSSVVVLRRDAAGQPTFLKLDLQAHLEQSALQDMLLQPFDVVYVPQTQIGEIAQFFDLYVNKIFPMYRNLGLYFTYGLNSVFKTP